MSNGQLCAISVLGDKAAQRDQPPHLLKASEKVEQTERGNGRGLPEIYATHQFHRWYTDVEVKMKCERDEKYRTHAEKLKQHISTCSCILEQVCVARRNFNDMELQHKILKGRGEVLQLECDRLMTEKARLSSFAGSLHRKLSSFDELEKVMTDFHLTRAQASGVQLMSLLQRLDECISFINRHPQYVESETYAMKFRQIQAGALATVRSHVHASLRAAVTRASRMKPADHLPDANTITSIEETEPHPVKRLAEGTDTDSLDVQFRATLCDFKTFMVELERRASRPEYADLIADCQSLYCEERLNLLTPTVQMRFSEYASRLSLLPLARAGCAYISQVCQAERHLYEHFFPSASTHQQALVSLMDSIGAFLHDVIRPCYLSLSDLHDLAELVGVLQNEVMQGSHRDDGSVDLLQPFTSRMVADVQERLIFRAQAFMRDEVGSYRPTVDDLDYPAKLQNNTTSTKPRDDVELKQEHEVAQEVQTVEDSSTEVRAESTDVAVEPESRTLSWYPPLDHTLKCLATLYRCVEEETFSGLAQEAIQMCTEAVQLASRAIARRSSVVDGQLFAIKHLLILREQIAPFDSDIMIAVKELDFSHMRGQMRRMLTGELSLFSLTHENALLVIASRGAPRIVESFVDSKKELEKQLKTVCEAYIMSVTKQIVEPMLSFITKVTAVKLSGAYEGVSLREAAFATPDKIADIAARVLKSLNEDLPSCAAHMRLYLRSPNTREILFKPIKSNIAEAHGQIAALLESHYLPEDVNMVGLMDAGKLGDLMDGLF